MIHDLPSTTPSNTTSFLENIKQQSAPLAVHLRAVDRQLNTNNEVYHARIKTIRHSAQDRINSLHRALLALSESSQIDQITVTLNDLTNLFVEDDGHTEPEHQDSSVDLITPVQILASCNLQCICTDLGLWKLESLPKVTIIHETTQRALSSARAFTTQQAWWNHVKQTNSATLKAFDYTADFDRRDFNIPPYATDGAKLVDFGAHGRGYLPQTRDWVKVNFAAHLENNECFYAAYPDYWRREVHDSFTRTFPNIAMVSHAVVTHMLAQPGFDFSRVRDERLRRYDGVKLPGKSDG